MSEVVLPVGQRIRLPGHFPHPVVLKAVRPMGRGLSCASDARTGPRTRRFCQPRSATPCLRERGRHLTRVLTPADADKIRLLVESARIRLGLRCLPLEVLGCRTWHQANSNSLITRELGLLPSRERHGPRRQERVLCKHIDIIYK